MRIYKKGELIAKKYKVTQTFSIAGQSVWGFVEYQGTEYFIKGFLTPVYPDEATLGTDEVKQHEIYRCIQFEKRHNAIRSAFTNCGECGLIVTTVDLFKDGKPGQSGHYFKVCRKVDIFNIPYNKIYTLNRKDCLLLMLTASFALKTLHAKGIIHLDLKPDNILIQKYGDGIIAKVIDFDNGIIKGEVVPPSVEIIGDLVYYSPELGQYISSNGESSLPTDKSDVFALGLIFCLYWTGRMPAFPSSYDYAYEAVMSGTNLVIQHFDLDSFRDVESESVTSSRIKKTFPTKNHANKLEEKVYNLISNMLTKEPQKRPSSDDVHRNLQFLYNNHEKLLNMQINSDTVLCNEDISKVSRVRKNL